MSLLCWKKFARSEEAWLIDTGRQDKIRVQRDTNTIFLSAAVHRPDLNSQRKPGEPPHLRIEKSFRELWPS
jgi:hypothetical protein